MKLFGSFLFRWYPATLIVTFFGLGYTHWCREAWLAIFTSIAVLISGYLLTPLIAPVNPTILDYGIGLIRVAAVIFLVGWLALMIFDERPNANADMVVIDYFWGLFVALSLTIPAMSYATKFLEKPLAHLCTDYINCPDMFRFLPNLLALAIPCVIYPFIGKWEFWPIAMLKRDIRISLGNFLVELIKALYTIVIFSALVFFFMKGDFSVMIRYMENAFIHIVPKEWEVRAFSL